MDKGKYTGAGIYALFDVVNYKVYIGKSICIQSRFNQHKEGFKKQLKTNDMYSEPLEHFVFMVLCNMTNSEFEKCGDLMEDIYTAQMISSGIPLYNRNSKYADITWRILSTLKTEETFKKVFESHTGCKLHHLKLMSIRNRAAVCENIKNNLEGKKGA